MNSISSVRRASLRRFARIVLVAAILVAASLPIAAPAQAAPAAGSGGGIATCETIKFTGVTLRGVVCFLGRCAGTVTLTAYGRDYVTQLTGWSLTDRQGVNVSARVCTDGYFSRARIVK